MAEGSQSRTEAEQRRATVAAWFTSGPGGIAAAVFVVALVILLILAAVGVL